MKRTHGNCAEWTQESAGHVMCLCGSMMPCWYSKHGNARKCTLWRPRNEELHLQTRRIVADYYEGSTKPNVIIGYANDGKRYALTDGHIVKARISGWTSSYRHYSEDDIGHCELTLAGAMPIDFIAIRGSEIGG